MGACISKDGATPGPPPPAGGKEETKKPAQPAGATKGPSQDKTQDPEFASQLKDFTPQFSSLSVKDKKFYCSCTRNGDKMEFAAINSVNGEVLLSSMGENELGSKKSDKTSWANFFKNLRNAYAANKISLKENSTGMTMGIPLEGGGRSSMSFGVKAVSSNVAATFHRVFLDPMTEWFGARRSAKDEEKYARIEGEYNSKLAECGAVQQKLVKLKADIVPLEKNCKGAFDDANAAKEQCDGVAKRIQQLKCPPKRVELYPDAPTQYILHTQFAAEHIPKPIPPSGGAMALIKKKYGGDASHTTPEVEGVSPEAVLEILAKIDDWDFDVFKLSEATNGNTLFMTTYTLLYKYGLVQHFKIPEDILINFLSAVESGYHPNPYHNSTHAADVLQITHYIISPGGMAKMIQMTKEDQLAALLSASIHDYDHPGFNNNFHCRTNSYLATLYNDRSVLENHHLAQIFDLMKNPKFNVLGTLDDDQRKDVRDTMAEMVLSTDMGNHAKIFQAFRKRLSDAPEWNRKEDQRLALTIAIKMADISNCGRPKDLYLQWAKRIAEEFYNQGDVEAKLKLDISPFMDRRKDKTDFSKGQISFMNYIVIPLFEAGAQFLSNMDFSVENIHANKDYWQKKDTEE